MGDVSRIVEQLRPVGEPGSATIPLLRLADAAYADGVSAPRDGVNAAMIARIVCAQDGADIPNSLGLSQL